MHFNISTFLMLHHGTNVNVHSVRPRRRQVSSVPASGFRWTSSPASAYLQAAEADHAVHHLSDAETVAEVVERVVLVVVMNAELEKQNGGRI